VGRHFGFCHLVKHAELDYESRDPSSALSFPRSVTGFVNPRLAAFHGTPLSRHSDGAALLRSNTHRAGPTSLHSFTCVTLIQSPCPFSYALHWYYVRIGSYGRLIYDGVETLDHMTRGSFSNVAGSI